MTYDYSRARVTREQIEKRIQVSERGCWLWTGALDSKGYGMVRRCPDGKRGKPLQIKAHRASWLAFKGPDGLGDMCVLHRCDTPRCVNPAHLWLGTKSENSIDRHMKGRTRGKYSKTRVERYA